MASPQPDAAVDVGITIHSVDQLVWPRALPPARGGSVSVVAQAAQRIDNAILFAQAQNLAGRWGFGNLNPPDGGALSSPLERPMGKASDTIPLPLLRITCGEQKSEIRARHPGHSISFEKHAVFNSVPIMAKKGKDAVGAAWVQMWQNMWQAEEDIDTTSETEDDTMVHIEVLHQGFWSPTLIGEFYRSVRAVTHHPLVQSRVPLFHHQEPGIIRGWMVLSLGAELTTPALGAVVPPPIYAHHEDAIHEAYTHLQPTAIDISIHWGRDVMRVAGQIKPKPPPTVFVRVLHSQSNIVFPAIPGSQNPTWSQFIVIPGTSPRADEYVTVSLETETPGVQRKPRRLGTRQIKLDSILSHAGEPRWINFYYVPKVVRAPVDEGQVLEPTTSHVSAWGDDLFDWVREASRTYSQFTVSEGSEDEEEARKHTSLDEHGNLSTPTPLEYRGSLLLSILEFPSIEQTQLQTNPLPITKRLTGDPSTVRYQLRVDLYSLTVIASDRSNPFRDGAVISVTCGSWSHTSQLEPTDEWPAKLQTSIDKVLLDLPHLSMAPSILIRVFAQKDRGTTMLAAAIPAITAEQTESLPVWRELSHRQIPGTVSSFGEIDFASMMPSHLSARILATVNLKEEKKVEEGEQVVRREEVKFEKKELSVLVMQAINVPTYTRAFFPSLVTEVTFAGATGATSVCRETTRPEWNQIIGLDAMLPEDMSMAGPLTAAIWATDPRGINRIQLLGDVSVPATHVMTMKPTVPEWFLLENRQLPRELWPKILLGFSNVAETVVTLPKQLQSAIPTDITLHLLGVRFLPLAQLQQRFPRIDICIGRDNTGKWLSRRNVISPWGTTEEYSGNTDLGNLPPIQIKTLVPESPLVQTMLAIEARDPTVSVEAQLRAVAYLHLTPLFPWMHRDDALLVRKSFSTMFPQFRANAIRIGSDFVNMADSILSPVYKLPRERRSSITTPSHMDVGHWDDVLWSRCERSLVWQQWGSDECVPAETSTTGSQSKDTGRLTDDPMVVPAQATTGVQALFRFRWREEAEGQTRERRASEPQATYQAEVCGPLESELRSTLLPYTSLTFQSPSGNGVPRPTGSVKLLVDVVRSVEGQPSATEAPSVYWAYRDKAARGLKIRVHVYGCAGVQPIHPKRLQAFGETPKWSIRVATKDPASLESLPGAFEGWDYRDVVSGFNPEFFQSYEVDALFPMSTYLTIELMEHDPQNPTALSSVQAAQSCISAARTIIDLEDRWCHPVWHERYRINPLVEDRELFRLPREDNVDIGQLNCGRIRLALEAVTQDEIPKNPFLALSRPVAMTFELRFIVWKIEHTVFPDDQHRNLFVRCCFAENKDDEVNVQDSDVHYGSEDGSARFNWRYVFRCEITHRQQPRMLTVQVWSSNILVANELLAEKQLQIGNVLAAQYQAAIATTSPPGKPTKLGTMMEAPGVSTGQPVAGQLMILKLRPPIGSYTTDAATVHSEFTILSAAEADLMPVGKGRDPPNRNPTLPDVTENRSILEASPLMKMAAGTTSTIKSHSWIFKLILVLIVLFPFAIIIVALKAVLR